MESDPNFLFALGGGCERNGCVEGVRGSHEPKCADDFMANAVEPGTDRQKCFEPCSRKTIITEEATPAEIGQGQCQAVIWVSGHFDGTGARCAQNKTPAGQALRGFLLSEVLLTCAISTSERMQRAQREESGLRRPIQLAPRKRRKLEQPKHPPHSFRSGECCGARWGAPMPEHLRQSERLGDAYEQTPLACGTGLAGLRPGESG